MNKIKNNEIDLFELAETLWLKKWIIMGMTFVAALIAVIFHFNTLNLFKLSIAMQKSKASVFLDYSLLNDILKFNGFADELSLLPIKKVLVDGTSINALPLNHNKRYGGYLINHNSVFQMFVTEFNDYEEIISTLQNDKLVNQAIGNLNKEDKQKELIKLSRLFKISRPLIPDENWIISFKWENAEAGKKLLNKALVKVLANVKSSIISDINHFSDILDLKNKNKIDQFNIDLDLIKLAEQRRVEKRIYYLTEQSAIAKELGILRNKLDANVIYNLIFIDQNVPLPAVNQKFTNKNDIYSNINSDEVPYYLMGSKSIDKQISVIKNRSIRQKLLMADGYIEIKKNISTLENDLVSQQLRNSIMIIENDNTENWVSYNLALSDVKSQKVPLFRLLLVALIMGGTMSVIFVLILNAYKIRKESFAQLHN